MLQSKARLLELNSKLAKMLTDKGVTATADETTTVLVDKVADTIEGNEAVVAGLISRTLTEFTIPDGITSIGDYAFMNSKSLTSVKIPNSVTIIGSSAFQGCTTLKNVKIPNSIKFIYGNTFNNCTNLEKVTLDDGFNANNLNLSASNLYTRETIVSWLNALADRTGQTAYKLTIGATNLKKLTQEDIAIATAKNWTLA